jgi:hypothetical protein
MGHFHNCGEEIMSRLVFFDDDADELKAFGEIVRDRYEYLPFHWPRQTADDVPDRPLPDIVVLDLYLPPEAGDEPTRIQKRSFQDNKC